MIRLDLSTRKLQAVLAGAVTANQLDVVVNWKDKGRPDYASFETMTKLSQTNGATPVDICDAPNASQIRVIDFVSVRNNDTASATVTVQLNDNGTARKLVVVTLATLEHLYYSDLMGWIVIGTDGQVKNRVRTAFSPLQIYDGATQGRFGGLSSEVSGGLVNFGINDSSSNRFGGAYTSADQGGFLRFDTRAGQRLWTIFGRAAASTGAVAALVSGNADGDVAITKQLDLSGAAAGQVKFPAAQNASADANTLDDYEEGTWTPAVTYATPGTSSVSYTVQLGDYTKVGRDVRISCNINGTLTLGTGSGGLRVSGLPFAPGGSTNQSGFGALVWGGITKANYTSVVARIHVSQDFVDFLASGSAQAVAAVTATDTPTGGTIRLEFTLCYRV